MQNEKKFAHTTEDVNKSTPNMCQKIAKLTQNTECDFTAL